MEGEGYEHGDYDDNLNANHFPAALWSAVHPVFYYWHTNDGSNQLISWS